MLPRYADFGEGKTGDVGFNPIAIKDGQKGTGKLFISVQLMNPSPQPMKKTSHGAG